MAQTSGRNMFCDHCGAVIETGSIYCSNCGQKQCAQVNTMPKATEAQWPLQKHERDAKTKQKSSFVWKKWMTAAVCCAAMVLLLMCIPWGALVPTLPTEPNEPMLSEQCDYVLCCGEDVQGNVYELVANQKESALGYEITVGVIKNNAWIYPLSKDFPFLDEDNLFHVSVSMGGKSGTSLTNPNTVIKNIYFIDTGAFLMEGSKATDSWWDLTEDTYTIFSCGTLKAYKVDRDKTHLLFNESDARFSDGHVISYGYIPTDNGEILLYEEVSGTNSGWIEDQVFDWKTLNTRSLQTQTLAVGVQGLRPESILAEGLIFASDCCFYNTSVQKVIDLTEYKIDYGYYGNMYFRNGQCTFTVENKLGTSFEIVIDKEGNVVSETAK